MDLQRIAQLRDELLHDRKWKITAAVLVLAFWVITIIAGVTFVRNAMREDRVLAHSVNTPSQVNLILEDTMPHLLNHIVYFNDVRLEQGPSSDVYFASSNNGHSVLVVSKGSKSASALNADSVDVQGTVRALPPTSTLSGKWKLSKDQVKALRDQGVYIEAESIRAKRPPSPSVAKK
jgi:hypothetical protein